MSTHPGCNQFKHAPGCGHPGATGGPAEADGVDLLGAQEAQSPDLDYPEPQQGVNCFHACPARAGGNCYDHGSTTWSTHPGDLEVRGALADADGHVISPVPDHEAQFFALCSASRHGAWNVLETYDTRHEAEVNLAKVMAVAPADIDAVRAAVDAIDPHDHEALTMLALAALPHLPSTRRDVLEGTVRPGGETIRWGGSGHDILARTLYAGLVDATQDVPTSQAMQERRIALDVARAEHTGTIVNRDMGLMTDADVREAEARANDARQSLERSDALRERASLRRVLAGRPTVFDVREIEERARTADEERRRAVNDADRLRLRAVEHPEVAEYQREAAEATARESVAIAEQERQTDALRAANAAWAALNTPSA